MLVKQSGKEIIEWPPYIHSLHVCNPLNTRLRWILSIIFFRAHSICLAWQLHWLLIIISNANFYIFDACKAHTHAHTRAQHFIYKILTVKIFRIFFLYAIWRSIFRSLPVTNNLILRIIFVRDSKMSINEIISSRQIYGTLVVYWKIITINCIQIMVIIWAHKKNRNESEQFLSSIELKRNLYDILNFRALYTYKD